MQIVVTKGDRDGLAFFSCAVGEGVGRWMGSPPSQGEWSVELELPTVPWSRISVVDKAVGISVADPARCAVSLVALVEACSSDGVVALRLGDGVTLVDTEGEPALGVVGKTIEFEAAGVRLFPYNI